MKYTLLIFFIVLCGCSSVQKDTSKLTVTVSILPQKYFVRRIAGDSVDVHVMIPPGSNPATYTPTTLFIKDLMRSKLYFRVGHIPFEMAWMGKIKEAAGSIRIIDTSEGVEFLQPSQGDHDDDHHDHSGADPHIWLSCSEVKIQVENITRALVELIPDKKEEFIRNKADFLKEIDDLDRMFKTDFESLKSRDFIVFHPVLGYLARDYRLIQHSIELDGKKPTPMHMKNIIDLALKKGIKVIFVQKQFDSKSSEAISESIKGRVSVLDPLAEEWLENMHQIRKSLSGELK